MQNKLLSITEMQMPKTSLRMFTRFISGVFSIHGQESYQ
jgi:hypothetical protein